MFPLFRLPMQLRESALEKTGFPDALSLLKVNQELRSYVLVYGPFSKKPFTLFYQFWGSEIRNGEIYVDSLKIELADDENSNEKFEFTIGVLDLARNVKVPKDHHFLMSVTDFPIFKRVANCTMIKLHDCALTTNRRPTDAVSLYPLLPKMTACTRILRMSTVEKMPILENLLKYFQCPDEALILTPSLPTIRTPDETENLTTILREKFTKTKRLQLVDYPFDEIYPAVPVDVEFLSSAWYFSEWFFEMIEKFLSEFYSIYSIFPIL